MLTYILLIGVGIWISFMVFVWFRGGVRGGRRYGNKIAKHLGMSNNVFHALVEHGAPPCPSLMFLKGLESQGMPVDRVSIVLGPYLAQGLLYLEDKFGSQPELEQAKPVIHQLVLDWNDLQSR